MKISKNVKILVPLVLGVIIIAVVGAYLRLDKLGSGKEKVETNQSTSVAKLDYDLPHFSLKYDPKANPEEDFEVALTMAKQQNKRILMMVGGDWCIWCRALSQFIKKHQDLTDMLYNNFVVLKVYRGPGNYNSNFLSKFPRVIATPHFYFFENSGKIIRDEQTAPLESGNGYDKLKLMVLLQKYSKN